jgi:hypothetical protein
MIPNELKTAMDANNDSLYAFANRINKPYQTVWQTASRWYARTDKKPHGGITKSILKKLRNEYPLTEAKKT